jgi:hypothetical protein
MLRELPFRTLNQCRPSRGHVISQELGSQCSALSRVSAPSRCFDWLVVRETGAIGALQAR